MGDNTEKEKETCEICGKEREGCNTVNWKRHTDKFKRNDGKKQNKNKRMNSSVGCNKMTKFFKAQAPSVTEPSVTDQFTSYSSSSSVEKIDFNIGQEHETVEDSEVQIVEMEMISQSTDECQELAAKLEKDVKDTIEVILKDVSKVSLKCRGFQVGVPDMYRTIACHELDHLDIIIENRNLHHILCAEIRYMTNDGNAMNNACSNLQYSPKLQKLLDRGLKTIDDQALMKTNNNFLSHDQLSEKARKFRTEKETLRLKLLNSVFRYSKSCSSRKTFGPHIRKQRTTFAAVGGRCSE